MSSPKWVEYGEYPDKWYALRHRGSSLARVWVLPDGKFKAAMRREDNGPVFDTLKDAKAVAIVLQKFDAS